MRARSKNSIGKLLKARENAGEQVTNAFVLRLIGLEDGASFHDQSQSEESHNTVIPDFFRQNWKLLCLHLFAGERIDARLKIALSPPPHWIAYWYCRKKLPVNLLVVVKRLSVCSVVKKHSLMLSEKSTGSRVAKVWGSILGAQFAKRDATRRDATRPRHPSFFAPPRIYFSSSQVCGSLIIKSLCGKIYLPLPSFSLNRQKTVLDSCAHRNAPSTRNIQQKGKKNPF